MNIVSKNEAALLDADWDNLFNVVFDNNLARIYLKLRRKTKGIEANTRVRKEKKVVQDYCSLFIGWWLGVWKNFTEKSLSCLSHMKTLGLKREIHHLLSNFLLFLTCAPVIEWLATFSQRMKTEQRKRKKIDQGKNKYPLFHITNSSHELHISKWNSFLNFISPQSF